MAHVDTAQSISEPQLHSAVGPTTSSGDVSASAQVGGSGFRPAAQAQASLKLGENGHATAAITATVGQGISSSACAMYEGTPGGIKTQAGICAQYNLASGAANVVTGVRADMNTGMTVGPAAVNAYASVVTSSNGQTSVEAGLTATVRLGDKEHTGSVGVRQGTQGAQVAVNYGVRF